MRNTIALQRGLILLPPAPPPGDRAGVVDSTPFAASLQAELMNLGFMLDASAFEAAQRTPREWLIDYHHEVIPALRKQLGAGRAYQPFYRNFPAQVMEMSDRELFINAIVHYWSDGTWEPPQTLRQRGFAFENVQFRPVRLGTEADLKNVFTKLVSINQSLTEQDKETLAWLIDTYGKHELPLPDVVPFKETLCILASKGMDVPVKTPTDVLRIAVYLSGGDISLPAVPKVKVTEKPQPWWTRWFLDNLTKARREAREKFKFRKFSRPQRRFILILLEKTNLDVAEMQLRLGRWLRLGEILHVGEHANQFPRTAEAFQKLRNQRKTTRIRTFAGRVDLALKEDSRKAIDLLATRPGEFARRLDWMLRHDNFDRAYVLATFERIGPGVSSKVLFELYNHFAGRIRQSPRVVMLKGKRSRMKTLPPLPAMDADLIQRIGNTILAILKQRFAALPPLGKVWIDPRLKELPVPFAMRSINTAIRTYVRGTRVPYRADAAVIRPFIHWFDENGDQDLDLSVGLYDSALKQVSHISFTQLKDDRLNCCHSGDIRHRKGPSAEYVDIDIRRCRDAGVRYAVVQAFNYNARPMHTVKDCVFGLMEREHATENEIFVPRTIANCMALANEGTSVVVCVIDLQAGNYIWADIESERVLPTLENTTSRTIELMRALLDGPRMSVHELLTLHGHARGTLVAESGDADVVMKWDDFVTDYARVAGFMGV